MAWHINYLRNNSISRKSKSSRHTCVLYIYVLLREKNRCRISKMSVVQRLESIASDLQLLAREMRLAWCWFCSVPVAACVFEACLSQSGVKQHSAITIVGHFVGIFFQWDTPLAWRQPRCWNCWVADTFLVTTNELLIDVRFKECSSCL